MSRSQHQFKLPTIIQLELLNPSMPKIVPILSDLPLINHILWHVQMVLPFLPPNY